VSITKKKKKVKYYKKNINKKKKLLFSTEKWGVDKIKRSCYNYKRRIKQKGDLK
jgi:tRNA G18 (ribose-2'-O)-methylase SpoU